MASLTLRCPHCGQDIPLPATVTYTDHQRGYALVKIDQGTARAHVDGCRTKAPDLGPAAEQTPALEDPTKPTEKDLAGRVTQMLRMGAFVQTGGSRACVLCGVTGKACLDGLRRRDGSGERVGAPCCSGCGNGDTHPVPKGTMSCAEWAAERERADQ
jgi:hypothetical protein